MLREVIARFTVDADTSKLTGASKEVDAFVGSLREVGGALIGAEIANRVKGFITEMVDLGDGIAATADKLVIGTTTLQQWQLAANLSDVETEAFNGSLTKFQVNLAKAAEEGGEAASAFKNLGIKDLNAAAKDTPGTLLTVARSIAEIGDAGTRNKRLIEVFGKQGAALGPMFSRGAEGIEELLGQLEATGGGLTEEAIEAMAGLDDATIKYNASVTSLKGKLALAIMPTLTSVVDRVTKMTATLSNSEGASKKLGTAMTVMGAAGFAAGVKMTVPYLPMLALIAGIILVVDDLKTGLEGGDSLTGRFLDRVFGEGAGDSVFSEVGKDIEALNRKMEKQPTLMGKIEESFSTLGASLVKFFADDLNEAFDIASAKIAQGKGEFIDYALVVASSLNPIGLIAKISEGYTKLETLLTEYIDGQKEKWRKMGLDIPDDIWKAIKEGAGDLIENMGTLADDMVKALKDKFTNMDLSNVLKIGFKLPGGGGSPTQPVGTVASRQPTGGNVTYASTNANQVRATQNVYVNAAGGSVEDVRRGVSRGLSDANDDLVSSLETVHA